MPLPALCLHADVIDRYLDDRLPAPDTLDLESHLSSCPACEYRLRNAIKSDPLLPLARSGPGSSWSVPVVLRNRLLDLGARAATRTARSAGTRGRRWTTNARPNSRRFCTRRSAPTRSAGSPVTAS